MEHAPRVGDLDAATFASRIRGPGLGVRMGPFDVAVHAAVPRLEEPLRRMYRDYRLLSPEQDFSFHVRLENRLQIWPRPQRMVRFIVDGRSPHADMPAYQALAVLEWGINLVVALRYHCFLMLHAAVVERHGMALVMPATPGSGKSTLCAALVTRGWRLLSDEFGLVRPGTTSLVPLPRLVPLKNESLAVIDSFAPGQTWGPVIPGTRKGTVRHLRPSRDAIDRGLEPAPLRWLVFPRWAADATFALQPLPRIEAFAQLSANAFNYEMLGAEGFRTARDLVQSAESFTLDYSNLHDAVAAIDTLAARHAN
jgi:HprK-related kinase A